MTPSIYVKVHYTINGKISFGTSKTKFQFTVPIEENNSVEIEILPEENSLFTFQKKSISQKMLDFLQLEDKRVPSNLKLEFSNITKDAAFAAKRVLTLIKYYLGHIDLSEHLVAHKKSEWSQDKTNWKPLPLLLSIFSYGYSTYPLGENSAVSIQRFLDENIEPFTAFRYLHKAKSEDIPQYQWIDATIAAELAIKEFFIRLKPDLETLLLEVPSPPTHKLYGSILESFGFEKSPKVAEIQKGVEIRNRLVHRPEVVNISLDKARKYVHDVEIAIYHLMLLLYPNDPIFKFYYDTLTSHSSLASVEIS